MARRRLPSALQQELDLCAWHIANYPDLTNWSSGSVERLSRLLANVADDVETSRQPAAQYVAQVALQNLPPEDLRLVPSIATIVHHNMDSILTQPDGVLTTGALSRLAMHPGARSNRQSIAVLRDAFPRLLAAEQVEVGGHVGAAIVANEPQNAYLVIGKINGLGQTSRWSRKTKRSKATERRSFALAAVLDASYPSSASSYGLMQVAGVLNSIGEHRKPMTPAEQAVVTASLRYLLRSASEPFSSEATHVANMLAYRLDNLHQDDHEFAREVAREAFNGGTAATRNLLGDRVFSSLVGSLASGQVPPTDVVLLRQVLADRDATQAAAEPIRSWFASGSKVALSEVPHLARIGRLSEPGPVQEGVVAVVCEHPHVSGWSEAADAIFDTPIDLNDPDGDTLVSLPSVKRQLSKAIHPDTGFLGDGSVGIALLRHLGKHEEFGGDLRGVTGRLIEHQLRYEPVTSEDSYTLIRAAFGLGCVRNADVAEAVTSGLRNLNNRTGGDRTIALDLIAEFGGHDAMGDAGLQDAAEHVLRAAHFRNDPELVELSQLAASQIENNEAILPGSQLGRLADTVLREASSRAGAAMDSPTVVAEQLYL